MKKRIYLRSISSKLSELQKSHYTRKIVNDKLSKYVPEVTDHAIESAETLHVTAKKTKKNRMNFFNADKEAIVQLDKDVAATIAELNKVTPYKDEQLSIYDFNNNDQVSNAIAKVRRLQQLEQVSYSLLIDEKKAAEEKTKLLLGKLNERLFYNIGQKKLPESISKLSDKIVQSILGKVMESQIGETITDTAYKEEVKEMLIVDLIAKAVALLPQDNSVLKNMKGKDAVNLIAKQAQNVQEDGSVSDLQTPKAAYDSAVRNFGKELVDAAIEANPLLSFLRQFFLHPQ